MVSPLDAVTIDEDCVDDLLAFAVCVLVGADELLAELLLLPSDEEVLTDRSDRLSNGLDGALPDGVVATAINLRGRSVGPTFRADLRKSLFVHLKLPVDDDTVFVGDTSVLGECGGKALVLVVPFSSDFFVVGVVLALLVLALLIGDLDFCLTDSNRPLVDLIELLRASGAVFGGDSLLFGGLAASSTVAISVRGGDALLPVPLL